MSGKTASDSEMTCESKRSSSSAKGVFQSAALAAVSSILRSSSATTPPASADTLLALALVSSASRKMRIDRSSVLFSSASSRSASFFSPFPSPLLCADAAGGLPSLIAATIASIKAAPRSPAGLTPSSSTLEMRCLASAKTSCEAAIARAVRPKNRVLNCWWGVLLSVWVRRRC